jgi:formate dehydrogenase (coenzyme F420) beta subunit
MTLSTAIPVQQGCTEEAITGFLATLLREGVVEAMVVPKALPSGDGFVPALIREPHQLEGICLVAPTMAVQCARVLSQLCYKMPPGRKIAALLKSCEIRAVIELAKFLQVRLADIYLIGIDCAGTFEVADYARMAAAGAAGESWVSTVLGNMGRGDVEPPPGFAYRRACQMCEYPVPQGDMVIRLFGYDTEHTVGLAVDDRLAAELSVRGLLPPAEKEPVAREQAVSGILKERIGKRDAILAEWRSKIIDQGSFLKQFSTCIRCHNCMVACPICYCKECVFKTDTFTHEGEQFLRWADRKGGIRLPADNLLFHMVRLSHMAASCIGCGSCESACPSHLPVATLFRSAAAAIQQLFDYVPGRDEKETPPLLSFREEMKE